MHAGLPFPLRHRLRLRSSSGGGAAAFAIRICTLQSATATATAALQGGPIRQSIYFKRYFRDLFLFTFHWYITADQITQFPVQNHVEL